MGGGQRGKSSFGFRVRTARRRDRVGRRKRAGSNRMRRSHGYRRSRRGGDGRGSGLERTCCLSHTGRTTGLRVGSKRWRAREVILVVCGRTSRRWVQSVLGLGGVGRGNVRGPGLGLRRVGVLRVWASFRLRRVRVMRSRGSSDGSRVYIIQFTMIRPGRDFKRQKLH